MKISVIIPVYNAASYIEECIQSCIIQEEVGEILVIDDGCTDGSRLILEKLKDQDSRITILEHINRSNLGAGTSRNLGIYHASCEYISFLDADDYYYKNRFVNTKNFFEQYKVDGIFESLLVRNRGEHKYPLKHHKVSQDIYPSNALRAILNNRFGTIQLCGFTFRKSFFDEKQIAFSSHIRGQDLNVIYGSCVYGKIMLKSSPYVGVRTWHKHNVSHNKLQEKIDLIEINEYWLEKSIENNLPHDVIILFLSSYLHYRPSTIHKKYRLTRNLIKIYEAIKIIHRFPILTIHLLRSIIK